LKLVNADCPDSIEVQSLLKKYDKGLLLYFLVCQRFIPQFIAGYNGAFDLNMEYKKFTNNYLIQKCKFPLLKQELLWSYFESLFKKYNNNKNFDINHFDLSLTEISSNEEGPLGKLIKSSLQIRDSVIVTNIYKNLNEFNKVFIVFGAMHLLAEKPTLDKLFEK
jgi:hypothetical protein